MKICFNSKKGKIGFIPKKEKNCFDFKKKRNIQILMEIIAKMAMSKKRSITVSTKRKLDSNCFLQLQNRKKQNGLIAERGSGRSQKVALFFNLYTYCTRKRKLVAKKKFE